MVTIGELYTNLKSMLRLIDIDTYAFEAKLILEKAFGSELPRILMNKDSAVPENILEDIQNMTESVKRAFLYSIFSVNGNFMVIRSRWVRVY